MNIKTAKKFVMNNKGNVYLFRYKGSRNQIDEFIGKIVEFYKSVFIVKVNDKSGIIKSFSYNDVLTGSLEISPIFIKK